MRRAATLPLFTLSPSTETEVNTMTRIEITAELERQFGPLDDYTELFEFDDFEELCAAVAEYLESMEG
jgi:hypothetical protein